MEEGHGYSLSDLPPELVELIVSQLDAAGLCKFGRCNKELKQLCNRDYWWQRCIHKEKPPVLLVATKFKKWKSIYRHCTSADNTDLLSVLPHPDKRIIFLPGVHQYPEELIINDHKQITGLYDIHWSNKTSDQKSVLICKGIKFTSYAHVDSAIVLSNLSIKLEKDSKTQFGLATKSIKATVTNCEIECGVNIRDKSNVALKNCHLFDGTVSGVSVMNSSITIENCRVNKNETGISLLSVGYEDTCQISDSTIIDNTRGINASNVQAKFQLKNNVIEYNKQFGVGTNSSRAALVQNRITNNHTGVFSCEMSLITLEDNTIKKNKYWGVCIQHGSAVGKFTGNQITHNRVVGVQLPESLKRPHLTSEALHTSNTFSDNETDIVLSNERVTDQGFIALAPFPTWAPLDSLEVLQAKLKMTIRRKFCTYNMTGTQSVVQQWFTCHTCPNKKMCATCVKTCHKGHQVIPATEVQHFVCECGLGSGCKALWK